jgi:CRP/FNR family transcriptional regulator
LCSKRITRLLLSNGNTMAKERFATFLIDLRDCRALLGLSTDCLR